MEAEMFLSIGKFELEAPGGGGLYVAMGQRSAWLRRSGFRLVEVVLGNRVIR